MTVYRFNKHSRVVRRRTAKLFLFSACVTLLIIGGILFLLNRPSGDASTQTVQSEVDYNPLQEFVTSFFRFSATDSWRSAEDLGNEVDTFVYRKYMNDTPVGILTIRVNKPHQGLNTHIVPLSVQNGRITAVGAPSEHCATALPPGVDRNPRTVTQEDVTFRCWTDGTNYIVAAGSRGGGLELPLRRVNGTVSLYSIIYQNTAFREEPAAILEILRTFEAR